MAEKKQQELVFIPLAVVGHIFPTIEFTKAVAAQYEDLFITVLIMKSSSHSIPLPESSDHPRIRFIQLNKEEDFARNSDGTFKILFENIELCKSHATKIVKEIANSGRTHLTGIVADMMCTTMLDVADELGVPSYIFFPTCASFLGLMFYLQSLRDDSGVEVTELKGSDKDFAVPTYINPVPDTILPSMFFEKGGGCDIFLDQAKRYRQTKGIFINTFTDLEAHAVQSLMDDDSIPPVYPIGPRLKLDGISDNRTEERDEILRWLDLQPESSVLFFCFGSMGSLPANQVAEIAKALERTGFRFLWSLRNPGLKTGSQGLPEGFLERTEKQGRVIGWAPQAAVLGHPAVAGFVTHCGWNSIIESVWNGVPIATWPVYAEQQGNAFLLVKDLDLAAEIKMDYRKDYGSDDVEIVSADLIENGIRKLMDLGNGFKKKMMDMKEKSRVAVSEGGSSHDSLMRFLDIVRNCLIYDLKMNGLSCGN